MMEAPTIETLLSHFRRDAEAYVAAAQKPSSLSALIWDACERNGLVLSAIQAEMLRGSGDKGLLRALTCAVIFRMPAQSNAAESVRHIFDNTLPELAKISSAKPARWLEDPEGGEELIRLVARDLNLVFRGELEAVSRDRLQSVSLLERQRLLAISREAEKRAKEIRQALATKAAREAADKYGRE